jgi:hypothetical protein
MRKNTRARQVSRRELRAGTGEIGGAGEANLRIGAGGEACK